MSETRFCILCGQEQSADELEPGPFYETPFGGTRMLRCRDRIGCDARLARSRQVKEVESKKLDYRIPRGMGE